MSVPLLEQLVEAFRVLPGVGQKTAQRMAYHVLERGREGGRRLAVVLGEAMEKIGHCERCRDFSETPLCPTCASASRDGQLLCDADLAVLASPPSAYAAYTAAVREEYHFVPGDAFREGRAAVLRRLLDLPHLFRTPYGREHWEATARYNLRGELEMLSTPAPPPS
jgi:predicted metal-dependent HD superfamily phosphohydrolase